MPVLVEDSVIKEDVRIWNKFREGDNQSFSRLFELFSDLLYRYGQKFVDDENTLKDCIQDLFVKLYDNRKSLPDTDNVKFFLFRLLKNKIIDSIREEKRIVYVSPQELQFSVKYYFDPEEEISGVEQDVKEKFEKIMNLLSNRQKEAIYLRYSMEMSYEEVAQLLNISYQSARNLIHRSIKKIRQEMDLPVFLFCFSLLH
jgi:RNA polymerase sigma factor (sigma-70 family)